MIKKNKFMVNALKTLLWINGSWTATQYSISYSKTIGYNAKVNEHWFVIRLRVHFSRLVKLAFEEFIWTLHRAFIQFNDPLKDWNKWCHPWKWLKNIKGQDWTGNEGGISQVPFKSFLYTHFIKEDMLPPFSHLSRNKASALKSESLRGFHSDCTKNAWNYKLFCDHFIKKAK